MSRTKKIWITVVAVLILAMVVLIGSNPKKNSYKKWVMNYLADRYSEKMKIESISFGDMGWHAKVHPTNNPDVHFYVLDRYIDRYLECYLEYLTEEDIEGQFPGCECYATMISSESIADCLPELYTIYKQIGRPPSWEEIPSYISLESMYVYTPKDYDLEKIKNYVESNCKVAFYIITDRNGNSYESH